jgi:hypothetical protein
MCAPCAKAGVIPENFARIGFTVFQVCMMGISFLFMAFSGQIQNWSLFPSSMKICNGDTGLD